MLLTLALGPACGDDTTVTPSSGSDSSTGDETTTTGTPPLTTSPLDSSGTTTDDMSTSTTGGETDPDSTTTDPDTTAGGVCGNGAVDGDEECDGDQLDGQDCAMQGFVGGDLSCADDCTFDTSMCLDADCGNDTIEGKEECDGAELGGQDCAGLGFDEGELACADDCSFDDSACIVVTCGNDAIEGMEICDGADLGGLDCVSEGFDGGTLACDANCMGLDTSGCFTCGDGVVGGAEQCDGADLAGQDCTTQGFMFGLLGCDATCAFDTSLCTNSPTFCSAPAAAVGPDGGTVTVDTVVVPVQGEFVTDVNVTVDATHTFVGDLEIDIRHVDTDTPVRMADNICGTSEDILATFDQDAAAAPDCVVPIAIEGDVLPLESLDGFVGLTDPGGTWELTIGDTANGDGGTLASWCVSFETSVADPNVCGDGVRTFTEVCDTADLNGETCQTQGFLFGDLACDAGCALDLSDCTNQPTFCSTPALAIGPNPGIVLDTIVVPSIGEFVTDVNVSVNANHTFVGDLDIDVRHVDTDTGLRLADTLCGGVDDINATFDQDAAAFPDCVAPIAIEGDVLPFGDLDSYVGLPDTTGTWELIIEDNFNGDGGTLNEWCVTFETSAVDPNVCGDGVVTFAEECEMGGLGGADCESQGFPQGGMLSCDGTCQFDTTGCLGPQCGDGVVDMSEECDGQEIAATSCEDLGFVGGPLNCGFPGCAFDTSECSNTVTAVCSTPAAPIDSALPLTTDTVNVPAGLNVLDVDVFVGITHTFNADLDMFLVHDATGTIVELSTDQCGGDDDVFAVYNDQAPAGPDCVNPVGIEGNVQPEGILAGFNGEAAGGDWTLQITDDAGGDVGVLDEWCIYIQEG